MILQKYFSVIRVNMFDSWYLMCKKMIKTNIIVAGGQMFKTAWKRCLLVSREVFAGEWLSGPVCHQVSPRGRPGLYRVVTVLLWSSGTDQLSSIHQAVILIEWTRIQTGDFPPAKLMTSHPCPGLCGLVCLYIPVIESWTCPRPPQWSTSKINSAYLDNLGGNPTTKFYMY